MNRLDFRLDDFTRIQWAPGAQSVWEPRFQEVSLHWQEIELELFRQKVKPSALIVVAPEELSRLSRMDISFAILGQQGRNGQPYASTSIPYVSGHPFDYRVAITTQPREWTDAWDKQDDDRIGELLGYPKCCRRFFKRFWVEQSFCDTTWPQAERTVKARDRIIDVKPNPYCNVTLRNLGLRWVSHLPCSFVCPETTEIGRASEVVIRSLYPSVWDTLSHALGWPLRWTGLHGIAEIVTPVCRVIYRTDATGKKYMIRQDGDEYPLEAARGNEFPFMRTHEIKLLRRDTWTENGFPSWESMAIAHNVLYTVAGDVRGKTLLDLGCGNGEMLRKLKHLALEVHGIDTNNAALSRAGRSINVRQLNIFDPNVFNRDFDLAFISVQRLAEEPLMAPGLIQRLKAHTTETVFYSYGEMEGWKILGLEPLIVQDSCSALKVIW